MLQTPQAPGSSAPSPQALEQIPTPPGVVVVSPAAVLAGLRTHANELESVLAGLNAQKQTLVSQLRGQPRDVRLVLNQQLAQVDLQIARTTAELATTRAQISLQGGTIQPPMPPRGRSVLDSDQITGIVIVFILAVLMPLSIGVLRRMWRAAPRERHDTLQDVVSPRLDRLEHAVDAIAVEVERISEGQRFVTKVLVDRPSALPKPMSVPVASEDASASLAEALPLRALGAGPAEPIRVPERQAVRSPITPH